MKKYLLYILIVLFILTGCKTTVKQQVNDLVFSGAGIAHDSTTTNIQNYGSSTTFSHTTSGDNRLLIVGITSYNVAPTGVTYDGVAMTEAVTASYTGASSRVSSIYFLVAPSLGSNNVVISYSRSEYCIAVASSYTGVLQGTPLDDTGYRTGDTKGPSSVTVTTSASGNLIYDALAIESIWSPTPSPDGSQTSRMSLDGTMHDGEASDKIVGGAGDYAMIYGTWDTSNCYFAHVVATFKAAPDGASDTCTPPVTGDWTVNLGDNCYVTSDTYIIGDLILIDNLGSGCLNVIDGATLAVAGWEATSTRDYLCLESDDGSALTIWTAQ